MGDLAGDLIDHWERLEGERTVWLSRWQDIANYVLPNRSDYIVQKTPGQSRMQFAYDSTPIWANEQLAAGLHGLLTSPTLRWFNLRVDDDRVGAMDGVQAWLDDTSDRMYSVYNGSKHNFASQSNELYLDLGSIGTAVMLQAESQQSNILFSTKHLRECCIAENEEDRVDTLIRNWEWTAKQAFQQWGAMAGEAVVAALGKNPQQKFRFLHAVRPRLKRDAQRADGKNKPFLSGYVNVTAKEMIGEGGFNEFPYHVPRFTKVSGETYGRGPGWTALPDVKMLNEMLRTMLKAAQKLVDPPLMLPDDGFVVPVKTTPGSLNFYRAGTRDRIEPLRTQGDIPIGQQMLDGTRQRILRAFYVDWLVMPSDPSDPASAGKGVTATYVLQQRDEKMRLLSPMLARMQSEFLGPLIDRSFAIMWRQSLALRFGPGAMLAPPPAALSGAKLRVEYVSPIAVAQRGSQMDAITRLIQAAQLLTTVDPGVAHTIDADATLRLVARDLSTPAVVLHTAQQVAQMQQAAAQAAAQQAQAQDGVAKAKMLKDGVGAMAHLASTGQSLAALAQGQSQQQEAE